MSKKHDPKNDKTPEAADEVPLALPEEVTDIDLASLSDSSIPTADIDPDALDLEIPTAASASSSNLFGGRMPYAHPPSADSGFASLEPLTPLQPASGWFDSQADQPLPGAEAMEANLAGPASGSIDGSDIFVGQAPSANPKSDISDVIAATAYGPGKPYSDAPMAKINPPRTSSLALNFNRPPVDAPDPNADVPFADNLNESNDSLFGGEEEQIDSARLARTPKLPNDDADLGSHPVGGIDASSILADFSEQDLLPSDSSAIRLEAPGMGATLREEEGNAFVEEGTEADLELGGSGDSNDPTHWHSQSGSDLFADRTRAEFELFPDSGSVDPFADELTADQPSLSSTPSSIFSGGKLPSVGSSAQSSGSVPIANPDGTDSVEFSDHPDMNAADSGSFHVLPAGAVDFNLSDDPHPERSMRMEIPEDEDDWTAAKTDPGPASGVLARRKYIDPTDEMAPVPAMPVKGKPVAEKKKDSSMEVNWVADTEEDDTSKPSKGGTGFQPVQGKQHRQDAGATARERKSTESGSVNKRGLAGLALGLLLGVGVSAGAYFSGVLPNKDESKNVAGSGGVSSEALAAAEKRVLDQTKIAADFKTEKETLAADLKSEKDKAAKFDKDLLAEKEKATTAEKNLLAEKDKTTTAEKALIVEKDKATTAEKNLLAEKDKTTAVEKLAVAEKEKAATAEKNLLAEKALTVKVEKDSKAMLDKQAVESKVEIDASKKVVVARDEQIEKLKFDTRKRDDEIARLKDNNAVVSASLVNAKLLPEKHDAKQLLEALKTTISRATGPDLSKLIPADLSAVAGTGLTTGHILDLASRANKTDVATKAATTEIAKLKADRDVQLAAMKDTFETEMKKLQDANAAELKKATNATTVSTDKLKAEQAATLKRAEDQYALEVKKANDASLEKVKAMELAIAIEKGRVAAAERKLQALGGTTTVASQQLDFQAKLEASRSLGAGIASYKAGRFEAALKQLDDAAKHDPNDALAWYFLGATHWAQGKPDSANADFKQGAEREVLRLVPARQIDDLISPIQGAARDALTAARP